MAIREFALGHGFGEADYLLFVDGQAAGLIEAKKEGSTLIGVEIQTQKYSEGIPEDLPAPRRPLPFLYQSTGIETRFTNLLEPHFEVDMADRGLLPRLQGLFTRSTYVRADAFSIERLVTSCDDSVCHC